MQHSVLEYLEQSAQRRSQAIAATDEFGAIHYGELLELSKRAGCAIAAAASRAASTASVSSASPAVPAPLAAQGRPVMVVAEKSIPVLCACFGALYAGGFYAPVDPAVPEARLASMYETLGEPLVVVNAETSARVATALPGATLLDVATLTAGEADEALLAQARAAHVDASPAYVLFTSGSTGTPKGVAVSHRAVIDFIDGFTRIFEFTENDVFANQAPFSFDVSVKDIYSAMAKGATLAIIPQRLFSQPAALLDYVNAQKATVMTWAVAALCLVSGLHGLDYAGLPTVRKVLFSGEVMPASHLRTWMERLPEALFVNLYGPTEITCNCTFHVVSRTREYPEGLPLGVAFPNRQIMLLDARDQLVETAGEQGEICVRGASLALGYYNAPEQTAKAFVRNPLQPAYPETIYRTGDLGRYNDVGDLCFCGRKDNQIKHLGHRIELEEVDAAFEHCTGITRCRSAFDPEKSRLYAFYEGNIEEAALMAQVQETLPVFMVPSKLICVETMPLTKNGKVDRKALLNSYLAEQAAKLEAKRAARKAKKEATHD